MRDIKPIMIALGLIAAAAFNPAFAHSFDIAVIAPFSGPKASVGETFWQGMRVATRERDGHPDETSDGHLGGVDSQLLRVDSALPPERFKARLQHLINTQEVQIAAIAEAALDAVVSSGERFTVAITSTAAPALNAFVPGTPDHSAFARQYQQQYAQPADAMALSGYAAAKLIDLAVRPLDGHFESADELRGEFRKALK